MKIPSVGVLGEDMCCCVGDSVWECWECEVRCWYDSNSGLNMPEAQIPRKHISRLISWESWTSGRIFSESHTYLSDRFKGLKPTVILLSRGISDAESSWRAGQGWQRKGRLRSVVWARTKPPPPEWVKDCVFLPYPSSVTPVPLVWAGSASSQ